MTLYLNGSTGISGVDGSAGTPAVQGTDANTGISFPAADTVAVNTGGSERSRVDSSGRLLVGTSSVSVVGASAPYARIQVEGNSFSSTGPGSIALRTGTAPASIVTGNEIGQIAFAANNTGEFARIDCIADGSAAVGDYPGRLVFSTTPDSGSSPVERLRIENSGLLRFSNDTTADKRRAVFATGPNDANFQLGFTNGTGGGANTEQGRLDFVYDGAGSLGRIGFWRGAGAQCARITVIAGANGVYLSENATTWTSASDERLKTDLVPIDNALDKIGTARAFTGRYHTDEAGVSRAFLIAQDFQSILPEAVNESNPDELGLNYSDVIPLLVAALKESKERIETLEAKVAALEAA